MIILSKQHILLLHEQLIDATGGIHGIRDYGLLDSALGAPFQSFAGKTAYPSIEQKAVRLGYGLIKNHPFLDGNKRVGVHVMLVLLALNGYELLYTQKELSNTILSVADGNIGYNELLSWVIKHKK